MPTQPKPRQTALDSWYHLRIELTEVEPPVWREVIVPARLTLPKLHSIILATMGWEGGHLHEFQFRDDAYGILDPDWAQDIRSENRVKLRHALAGSKRLPTPTISATTGAIWCRCWRNSCRFRVPTGYAAWQGKMPARP